MFSFFKKRNQWYLKLIQLHPGGFSASSGHMTFVSSSFTLLFVNEGKVFPLHGVTCVPDHLLKGVRLKKSPDYICRAAFKDVFIFKWSHKYHNKDQKQTGSEVHLDYKHSYFVAPFPSQTEAVQISVLLIFVTVFGTHFTLCECDCVYLLLLIIWLLLCLFAVV